MPVSACTTLRSDELPGSGANTTATRHCCGPFNRLLALEYRQGGHGSAVRPVDHIDHFHSVAVWGNFPPYIADDLAIADQFGLGYVAVDALVSRSTED